MGLFCFKFSYATAYFDRSKKLIKQKVFVMKNFRNLPKEHRKSKSKFCAMECWKSNVISLPPSKLIRESTVSFPFSGRIRKKIHCTNWRKNLAMFSFRSLGNFLRGLNSFLSVKISSRATICWGVGSRVLGHRNFILKILFLGWKPSNNQENFLWATPLNTAQDSFFFLENLLGRDKAKQEKT